MRVYTPITDDTLHRIACKKYYVYNDQGDEDTERVAIVIREIMKRNPDVPSMFGFRAPPTLSIEDDKAQGFWENTLKSISELCTEPGSKAAAPESQATDPQAPQPQAIDPAASQPPVKRASRQPGPQIVLPIVPGIPAYEATQGGGQAQKWFYLALWFLGIVVGMGFYLAQQYLIQQSGNTTALDFLSWLRSQLLTYILAPSSLLSAILPRVVLWSLAVWAAWLCFRPVASSPVLHLRLRYFVGWIIGLIALIPGLYLLIIIVVPGAAPAISQYADLFPLLAIWTILMFLLYLYLGDGSELHQDYLVPFQGIWTVLALIILGTILAGYSGYQQVSQRIQGELSTLTLAQSTIQQLHGSTHSLVEVTTDLARQKRFGSVTTINQAQEDPIAKADENYVNDVANRWPELRQYIDSVASQSSDAQAAINAAMTNFSQRRAEIMQSQPKNRYRAYIAGIALPAFIPLGQTAEYTATEIYTDTDYIQEQIDTLGQIGSIITPTIQSASILTQTADHIQSILMSSALPTSTKAYSTGLLINNNLLRLAYDLDLKAAVADSALTGTKFDSLPLFLWNGVFMAVLVLFPWLLLLLFLYRKRVNLAAQIYTDLLRLDPHGRLLRRVLDGSNSRYERKVRRENMPNGASRNDNRQRSSKGGARKSAAPAAAAFATPAALARAGAADPDHVTSGTGPSEQQNKSENELIDLLAARTFSGFEYLVSLIFLSLLLAVGWYYVFYPQTSIGLTNLIERGAGVRQLTGFITANLTPLTMGFAGAYFFLMQMLVRRYLSDDLYPAAFLQAVQRLLLIFMLSLALTILTVRAPSDLFTGGMQAWEGMVITIAFLIGIYPTSGLQLLITLVNRKLRRTFFPPTLVPEPITKLSGVTIWIEARLLEENIESIEAMATAPIERLVVGTHFPPAQIVDWIDQAILYLHAGHNGEWFSQLRAVGVRGASDLLDVTGLNLADPQTSLNREDHNQNDWGDFVPNEVLLNRLVEAVTSANASGVPERDPNDPRGMARASVNQLVESADAAAKTAKHAHELIALIDPKDAQTFEVVRLINAEVEQANAFVQGATSAAAAIDASAAKLGASDQEQRLRASCAELKATVDAAAERTKHYTKLATSSKLQPITLEQPEQLSQVKIYIANLQHQLADLAVQLNTSVHIAGALATDDAANAPAQELQQQALALIEQHAPALAALDTAATRAVQMDPKKLATLDAREELKDTTRALQAQAAGLKKQLGAVEEALMGDDITKTQAQQQTIQPSLNTAKSAADALQQPTTEASTYATDLLPWPPEYTTARITPSKDTVLEIDKLVAAAQSQIKSLSAAAGTITAPPQLTAEILWEMCDAIWPAPNLPFVLNFYQQGCDDLVTAKHSDTYEHVPGELAR